MKYRGRTNPSGLLVVEETEIRRTSDTLAADIKGRRARPGILARRPVERVLHLPSGRTVRVLVDEAGNSHHETDDRLDAVARPDTLALRLRTEPPAARRDATTRPGTIRTAARAMRR